MNTNSLLPEPHKVRQNDTDTIFDIRQINMKYKFGKFTATEAMEKIENRLNKHDEDYENLYRPFNDAMKKGDKNND